MNQLNNKQRETKGVCLLGALSKTIKAQRRGLTKKLFGYRKIRPIMTLDRDDASDLSEVILQESSNVDTQVYCNIIVECSQSVLTCRSYYFSNIEFYLTIFYLYIVVIVLNTVFFYNYAFVNREYFLFTMSSLIINNKKVCHLCVNASIQCFHLFYIVNLLKLYVDDILREICDMFITIFKN